MGEQLRVVLGVANAPSGFGEINIVADLPKTDVHMVNDQWAEVARTIKPSEMKGVLITHMSTSDIAEIMPIYQEWMAQGGSMG